jgi:hypothetical protein
VEFQVLDLTHDVPDFTLFGGPNGAGKTTTALRILPTLGCREFINADLIAQGISPLDVDAAAFRAGVLLMRRLRELADKNVDFATESTLAARAYVPLIEKWRERSYRFTSSICGYQVRRWPLNALRRAYRRRPQHSARCDSQTLRSWTPELPRNLRAARR